MMNLVFGASCSRIEFGRSPKRYAGEEAWKNKVNPELLRRFDRFEKVGRDTRQTVVLRLKNNVDVNVDERLAKAGLEITSPTPTDSRVVLGNLSLSNLTAVAKLDETLLIELPVEHFPSNIPIDQP
jgi:hypothetical protein